MTDATTSFANAIANREFFTWEQFESALAHYMAKNFVVFSRVSSIRSSDELLRFDRASYQCKMHAARADVGEGMGVMHSRLPPCTARFYLRRKKTRLVVTSFNMDHNHPVSKTLYDHLPSTGRINSSDLERRRHSIDYNLPCYDNQDFAGDKEITTMDIRSYRRQSKPIPARHRKGAAAERFLYNDYRISGDSSIPLLVEDVSQPQSKAVRTVAWYTFLEMQTYATLLWVSKIEKRYASLAHWFQLLQFRSPENGNLERTTKPWRRRPLVVGEVVSMIDARKAIPPCNEYDGALRSLKRQLVKTLMKDRELWWKSKARYMEKAFATGNSRALYQLIRSTGPTKATVFWFVTDAALLQSMNSTKTSVIAFVEAFAVFKSEARIILQSLSTPFAFTLAVGRSCLHTSAIDLGSARTYESKPIPGSREHLNPNEWAERLFKLHERRKDRSNAPPTLSEPPLLHMVCRVKPLKNTVHYERAILERHGLGENLYQVKHLVRIQPVQFPQGLPTALDDLTQCRLRPDGRFLRYRENTVEGHVVTNKGSSQLLTTAVKPDLPEESFEHSNAGRGYLKRRYLRQWHNRQWSRFSLFQNFFTSHYRYKLNQDGSEYRYSHLWRLDDAMFNAIRKRVNTDGSMKSPNQNRFEANWCTFPWARF
ncbi:hypothetical protein CLF_101431 [Clonorchis sinensis]|uniref:Uncharacterized protein n=1 Tax=Clonorchis sinensis TaxID=79923 RepID=G7Y5Q9_CLOSI|nr:hypothetical protein CLF_101431 [Clonorchis sinensis]